MQHQITPARVLMDMLLDDGEILERERKKLGEDVVVVAPQINDLGAALLHLLEDAADETRVGVVPAAAAHKLSLIHI